jgi:hypothetical protein
MAYVRRPGARQKGGKSFDGLAKEIWRRKCLLACTDARPFLAFSRCRAESPVRTRPTLPPEWSLARRFLAWRMSKSTTGHDCFYRVKSSRNE